MIIHRKLLRVALVKVKLEALGGRALSGLLQ
jgi:hypothetical protein